MEQYIFLVVIVLVGFCEAQWRDSDKNRNIRDREARRIHYHTKRHMLTSENDAKVPTKPQVSPRGRDWKKMSMKPSGHLKPLKEDEIENEEVMSVAIGPPPMHPTYERPTWKARAKNMSRRLVNSNTASPTYTTQVQSSEAGAISLVKNVLTQIAKEFVTTQVSEDFVFGQYVGLAMKNITSELKMKFQHEILDTIVKYQKLSRNESLPTTTTMKPEDGKDKSVIGRDDDKGIQLDMRRANDTVKELKESEDSWPDFNNLAKLVG